MKPSISLIIALIFILLAVFGFSAMSHSEEHGHIGCLAATASNADCPAKSDAFDFFSFHLGALKFFSTAVFSKNLIAAFFLIFAAAILQLIFSKPSETQKNTPDAHPSQFLKSAVPLRHRQNFSWLSLLESSPNAV
ncbi:hypothetical protein HYV91_01440 [Candidatus Wolfebacteria bacterium]|nr:hypothetical protein [Candidatus Wolfebacteria bacterium]